MLGRFLSSKMPGWGKQSGVSFLRSLLVLQRGNRLDSITTVVGREGVPSRPVLATRAKPGAGAGAGLDSSAACSSNTKPSICAFGKAIGVADAVKGGLKFQQLHMGFDTVEWSLKVSDEDVEMLVAVFGPLVGKGEQADNYRRFVVSRIGGFIWRFKVTFASGFEVFIPDVGFSRFPVKFVAHSTLCLVSSDLMADLVSLIEYLCCAEQLPGRLSLTRVDVCSDLLMSEGEFQRFSGQVARGDDAVVSRARKVDSYRDGDRFTGVSVGRESIKLRVYDKFAEAEQGGDWSQWSLVYGRGKEFEVAEGYVVARFEYQLRREFLQECCTHGEHADGEVCSGVTSLEEFQASAADVFAYLTDDWFRVAGPARGHDHVRVARPFWRSVAASFVQCGWSSFTGSFRRRLRRCVAMNMERLADMAGGCLASIAAVLGHEVEAGQGASMERALSFLGRHMDRDREHWQQGRDRRYKALLYGPKWRSVPV
jgi:hypothetical protein